MSLCDCRGIPVSTKNRSSLERLETAVELLHGYAGDPLSVIDRALAEDPGFVMGHCFRAALYLVSADRRVDPDLKASVAAAQSLAGSANDRERQHIVALRTWLDGDWRLAAFHYGRILLDYPRDSLALQIAHTIDYFIGDLDLLRDRIARALPDWDPNLPGHGYLLGMHAFGLEETGHFQQAEESAGQALEINPRDVWALHALAHVFEATGRPSEGSVYLNARRNDWSFDNVLAVHNWWHLALYHLDLREIDQVLALYDSHIRASQSGVLFDLVDASALLWRLYLCDANLGNRYAEVSQAWQSAMNPGLYAFNAVHAMMSFAATNNADAAELLTAMLEAQSVAMTSDAEMIRAVALPACLGIHALAQGEYGTAVDRLERACALQQRLGGSNAQRDVLKLTLIEAALRGDQRNLARALTAERLALKSGSRHNEYLRNRAMRTDNKRSSAI
jgi:tetratricopeptide (TPR) repeat protein